MTNAWNVTEAEYKKALELSRDSNTSPADSAAYWQLCRYYRDQIFNRDDAARAVRLIRAKMMGRDAQGYDTVFGATRRSVGK